MKFCLTFLLTFFLFALTVFAQEDKTSAVHASKAPKLIIETLEHDFGLIKESARVSHVFLVKNEGKADLLIESVAPS